MGRRARLFRFVHAGGGRRVHCVLQPEPQTKHSRVRYDVGRGWVRSVVGRGADLAHVTGEARVRLARTSVEERDSYRLP